MTPERAAGVVARWVRFYTREVPTPIAERRIEEIGADLHDHISHERAHGTNDLRTSLSVLWRMARGMLADLAWRRRVRTSRGDLVKPFLALFAAALVVAALALVLDSPLLVLLSIAMIGFDILGVLALGLRTAQRGAFVKPFIAIIGTALVVAAIGVTAIVVGDRGDAPGLVLLGIAVITSVVVGAFALGVRTAQRSS